MSEWAVLGVYLVGSIIVGCVFGLLIRAARALMDWRSSRDIPRFSINDWLQVTSGDEEFRHQVEVREDAGFPKVGGAMRDDLDEALAAHEHSVGRPYLADSDHCDKCAEVDQAWTEADLQDKFGPLGPMLLSSAGIPWFFDPNIVENP